MSVTYGKGHTISTSKQDQEQPVQLLPNLINDCRGIYANY